jgi:hypothetical protein
MDVQSACLIPKAYMKKFAGFCLLLSFISTLPVYSLAQTQTKTQTDAKKSKPVPQQDEVVRINVNLVQIDVTVMNDKCGPAECRAGLHCHSPDQEARRLSTSHSCARPCNAEGGRGKSVYRSARRKEEPPDSLRNHPARRCGANKSSTRSECGTD